MLLSKESYKKIDAELAKFPADKRQSALIASLAIAQDEKKWLSLDVIEEVASYIGVSPVAAQEVATFYNMFDTQPVGNNKISVCTNLPCALRGSEKISNCLKKKLDIDFRETTVDKQFTLVESECLGACGDAPVLIVNNKHMCVRMNEEKIDYMIDLLSKEKDSNT